jgi:hypothetical protein
MWIRGMNTVFLVSLGLAAAGQASGATLPARAPGLWKSITTVTGPDGQPLPNAANVVTISCVDPATDIKFFISGGSACSSLRISGSGMSYAIDGTCTQLGKPVSIHETLVYADARNVTLKAKMDSSAGLVNVTSQLQWQGDCLAGMAPGDEGSIMNGAFSKADNIDDSANQ